MDIDTRGEIKVLRATPGANERTRSDRKIHLPTSDGFNIQRASKQYYFDGQTTDGQTPKNRRVAMPYEAMRKRLLRHSGLIVVLDPSAYEESSSAAIPLDLSVALGIEAVKTLSKAEVLFGAPDSQESTAATDTSIINVHDILSDSTSIHLNTSGLEKLYKQEKQKPFVIVNGSGTLSEMHTVAPKLPNIPGFTSAKVLIDARGIGNDNDIIDTLNAVNNPLAWRGKKIGGIAINCPKDMHEAEQLKTTLAKVIPRVEMSGVMNSARGTFRHLG
jgi:hypothetical protein